MITYLSPVPWSSFEQRPHKYVRWVHLVTGQKVLWVEPHVTRLPHPGDFSNYGLSRLNLNHSSPEWLEVLKVPALPFEPLRVGRAINSRLWSGVVERIFSEVEDSWLIAGKPSALLSEVLRLRNGDNFALDVMDYYPDFYSGKSRVEMRRNLEFAMHRANYTSFSGEHLCNSLKQHSLGPVEVIPNGFEDQKPDSRPRRNKSGDFGYIGTVAKWFDFDVLRSLSELFPKKNFRIIGPRHTRIPSGLATNVSFEKPLPHNEAIAEMRRFSAGLIPFKVSPLTNFVDPIKYHEYRSLGLPVVSTCFGEMRERNLDRGLVLLGVGTVIPASQIRALLERESIEPSPYSRSWNEIFEESTLKHLLLGRD